MQTATLDTKKPSVAPSREDVAKARKILEDLVESQDLGVVVTGFIEAAEKPALVSGQSSKGRAYAFWNRRVVVKINRNGQTVTVAQTRDSEKDFEPLDMNGIVSFKIGSARMDGPVMVLRELREM